MNKKSDEKLIAESPVVNISTDSTQSITKEFEAQAPVSNFEACLKSQENTAKSSNVVTFPSAVGGMRWIKSGWE